MHLDRPPQTRVARNRIAADLHGPSVRQFGGDIRVWTRLGPGHQPGAGDAHNGAGRNPYHTYDILELRLNGTTLLKGYHNQVLSSAAGMVAPEVAMDGALLHQDVLGGTAVCVAEVPKLAFANWRRSLVQRVGRYVIVADDLTFRTDSENMKLAGMSAAVASEAWRVSWDSPG